MNIELFEVKSDVENRLGGWTMIVDGHFADGLCPDEALGVIAQALFGGDKPVHHYLQTYEGWISQRKLWTKAYGPMPEIAGLLPAPEHFAKGAA